MKKILVAVLLLLPSLVSAEAKGDFVPGSTIYCTSGFLSAGGPFALAGTPVITIYKDASTSGNTSSVTLVTSFASNTAVFNIKIDTSVDGTFFSAGHDFSAVITTGTVNGANVAGAVPCSFSLNHASVATVAGAVASVTAPVTAGTVSDKTGYALTAAYDSAKTASQAGDVMKVSSGTGANQINLSSGHVTNVDTLTTYTGNTVQTGDAFARIGAPAGASVSADIAGIPAANWGYVSRTLTGSAGITAADVWTYSQRTLTAFDFGPTIIVENPVTRGNITIVPGAAYMNAPHSLPLDFTIGATPILTLSTPKLSITSDVATVLSVSGTVVSSGGTTQTVRFELTAAQTATLTLIGKAAYDLQINATWSADSPTQPTRLISGVVNTERPYLP